MITSEWPSKEFPYAGKFVFDQAVSLRDKGIDLDVYTFRGNKNPILYLKHIIQVWRKCRLKRYDLVHCQFGQSGLMALMLSIPFVITFRGTDLNGYKNSNGIESIKSKVLRFISGIVAKKSDQVIVVSKKLAAKLPKGLDFKVLPSGIDLELFKPIDKTYCRNKLKLPQDKKIIFFPSDPNREVKRFDLAEKAFLQYNKINHQSILLTTNNIPYTEMVYYFNASDLVLFTSKNEGSPNVIKEAMACNTPVLTVDVGDVSEYVNKCEGNIICSDDIDVLSQNLIIMTGNENSVCSRDVISKYSKEYITEELIKIYQSIVKNI
jgi:teichuronic acid biosynthesis glycosyltransferase TuaC